MELLADDFNEFLSVIGQDCLWRKSWACPCVSPNSGAASTTCTVCSGAGRLWDAGVQTTLGKTGSDAIKRWAQFGMYDEGDTVMTVGSDSPAYAIAAFDRVLMLNQTEPFSQAIVPGVNSRLKFPALSVDRVFSIVSNALVDHPLPTVNPDGTFAWPGGAAPVGQYSISGRRRVEFFAFTAQPFDRPHEHGEPLPRRIVMKRFDLFGRQE